MLSFGDQGSAMVTGAAGPYSPLPTYGADDELARGLAWARRLVDSDRAASTIEKYTRDWALFVHWLGQARPNLDPVPAHPAAVGIYIGVLRERGLTKQTILGRTAAIAYVHDMVGVPSPLLDPTIRRQLRGLRRQTDSDRQERGTIERETATSMAESLADGSSLYELRDRAIFSLGWLSALRRSNIAALRRRDVAIKRDDLRHTRYLEIFVVTSKTDQERRGRYVIVNELATDEPLCAVRAVGDWLSATDARGGESPLFPTFARRSSAGHLTDRAIDGRDVARAVKRIAENSGFDGAKLAAHALRRGFATSAINRGVRRSVVRDHGGWKTDAMLDRYTRVEKSRDNAVSDLFTPE